MLDYNDKMVPLYAEFHATAYRQNMHITLSKRPAMHVSIKDLIIYSSENIDQRYILRSKYKYVVAYVWPGEKQPPQVHVVVLARW